MLVWSKPWRIVTWALAVPLFLVIYGLPIGVIVLASFSGQWNDILPSNMTLVHYAKAFRTDSFDALKASLGQAKPAAPSKSKTAEPAAAKKPAKPSLKQAVAASKAAAAKPAARKKA